MGVTQGRQGCFRAVACKKTLDVEDCRAVNQAVGSNPTPKLRGGKASRRANICSQAARSIRSDDGRTATRGQFVIVHVPVSQ